MGTRRSVPNGSSRSTRVRGKARQSQTEADYHSRQGNESARQTSQAEANAANRAADVYEKLERGK